MIASGVLGREIFLLDGRADEPLGCSIETSALSREISEKAAFSASRSASRLSARVFIYGRMNAMEECDDEDTYGADSIARGDQLMVVIVHKGLPVGIELSDLCVADMRQIMRNGAVVFTR
jgi:hypothetical protein